MADTDELLDQQVHDAFERIELGGEAQDMMLANLLSAQSARTGVDDVPSSGDAADAGSGADVIPFVPRRPRWRALLPVAAVLVAALVVVRIGMMSGLGQSQAASDAGIGLTAMPSEDKALVEEGATAGASNDMAVGDMDAEEEFSAEEVMLDAAPEAATERELTTVDLCPLIELADGRRLSALVDGLYTVEVDAGGVGESVGEATARPFDSDEGVACTVYRLTDGDGYAVQYDGEDTFWRCDVIDDPS